MKQGPLQRSGALLGLAIAAVLVVPTAASAAPTLYTWTVDGKPPTTVNDLHLHFQIVKSPFTFGGVLIDDDANFGTAAGTIPDAGGNFTIDFGGAAPNYGPTDNVHVAFNFVSSEDVKLVFAEWTLDTVVVGVAQAQDLRIEVHSAVLPTPGTLPVLALGLALLGATTARQRRSA